MVHCCCSVSVTQQPYKTLKLPQLQDVSVMLPLWRDDSKSLATIKHLPNVLIQTISYLNPGQTAVIGLDQPLYAIVKRIQWLLPNEYDQNKVALMLGALHIEMTMLSCIGDLLEDCSYWFGSTAVCYCEKNSVASTK